MDVVSALRAEEPIERSVAIEAAEFLMVVGRVDPRSAAVHDAATALATHADEPLGPLVDWWLVTVCGGQPVGIAHLVDPGWVPSPLDDWMRQCLDLAGLLEDQTVAEWVLARRRVREAREKVDGFLKLHDHGGGKFGGETAAWDHVTNPFKEYLRTVDGGGTADVPRSDFKRLMKGQPVKKSSDAFTRARRRYGDLHRATEEYHRALETVTGPKKGPGLLAPTFDPSDLADGVGVVLTLALESFVPPSDGSESLVSSHMRVRDGFGALASATPEADRAWLARLTESWREVEGVDDPHLDDLWARREAMRMAHANLAEAGVEASTVADALMADDLDEAEAELQRIENRRHAETLTGRYRNRAAAIRRRIELDHPGDDEMVADLELAEADVSDGRLDDVPDRLRDLEGRLQQADEEHLERLVRELFDEATRIGAIEVAVALDGQLDRLASGERPPTAEQVDAYREEVLQYRSMTDRRLRTGVAEVENRLGQAADGVDPALRESIEGYLRSCVDHLDAGDLPGAEADLRSANRAAERGVFPVWEHVDGERELVDHVIEYLSGVGEFAELDVRRLHVSLKTRPFVVLAGLSGAGKSTIARAYAEALGANAENGRFRRVAVRPNWVDETEVLGYVSPVDDDFKPGWLASLIRECNRQPALPFFCVLDEMNLAPVEYYLADLLSAMEDSGGPTRTPTVPLYTAGRQPKNAVDWPAEIAFPENLFLLGTVNVDETTRVLSDRVLDRANVIQIGVEVGDGHHRHVADSAAEPPWMVRMEAWRAIRSLEPAPDFHEVLVRAEETFGEMGLGLGMRSHLEIERFVANAVGIMSPVEAFDLALVQRLIPKVRGYKADLADGLDELSDLLSEVLADLDESHTLEVLGHWCDSAVGDDEYVDGTDPRVGLWRP